MDTLKKISFIILAFFSLNAQAQTDKETTVKLIEQKNFVFVANSAIPLNNADVSRVMGSMNGGGINAGGTINLTGSNYDLRITADSLVSYLPFYGRAFRASNNTNENGHRFTSKDFTYTSSKRKKGGWNIAMNTKDVKDNVRMNLSVSENGYGSLTVVSNDKQSITYNGYLKKVDEKR